MTILGSVGVFVFPSLCFKASLSSLSSPFVQNSPLVLLSFFPLSLAQNKKLHLPSSLQKTSPSIAGVESSIYRQGERPAVAHEDQGTPGEVFNRRGFAGHAFAVF